tara:strand:+ start:175 stop:702 length:528 start_codon:yes stop_codon:yes gene_type:complete
MTLWGNKDTVYSTGKVNCSSAGVVTKQSGSIAWTAGNGVKVGQVLTLATDGSGPGQGIILSIDSATQITLTKLDNISATSTFSNVDYEIRETPVYEVNNPTEFGINEIFGVDEAEIETANAASGDARKYAPPHAGWVGITSYTDMHGNLRVKTETLVASSSITGDSQDDTILPDA